MKKMNDVMEEINIAKPLEYQEPFVDPAAFHREQEYNLKIINRLFERLTAICPAFRHSWPTQKDFDNTKLEWMKAFKLANLFDVEKIKRGIEKYSLLPTAFVPSPGQFIKLCQEDEKEIRPQSDTRDYLMLEKWNSKTDEDKERSKRVAKHNIANMLDMLRK
jgi:hypothetical protein